MAVEEMEKAKSTRLAALKASMEAGTAVEVAKRELYTALGGEGVEASDPEIRPLWDAANAAIQKHGIAVSAYYSAAEAEREAIAEYHYHRGLTEAKSDG